MDHIGTGEGAQAFGWGLYFAGKKAVAKHYRENLSGKALVDQALESYDRDYSLSEATEALFQNEHLTAPEREFLSALQADDWLGFDYPH